MISTINNNLHETAKFEQYKTDRKPYSENYIDIHCHCLPAIDDGPATKDQAVELCRELVRDGITTVIATPHQLGRFNGYNDASKIRECVSELNETLHVNSVPLEVMAGADVRIDERISKLLDQDVILTLADNGKHILLELPQDVFIDFTPLLKELALKRMQVIISHPERHPAIIKNPDILLGWFAYSTRLQITASSLLGNFGKDSQKTAWYLLSSGMANIVATDAHNLNNRRPCMKTAFAYISARLGNRTATAVCIENPLKIIKGQDIPSKE